MTDLLFIELGAVVTEILGPSQCTIEPFCNTNDPPTYSPEERFTVDFEKSLDELLLHQGVADAAQQAEYDVIVAPSAGRRVQLGRRWPGGGYEGILCVRAEIVQGNTLLDAASKTLDGFPGSFCRYQVVASIAPDKSIRRYEGQKIVFKIGSRNDELVFDPDDEDREQKFYTGDRVEQNIARGGLAAGETGAVFMTQAVLASFTGPDDDLPKLPPSAGL